MWCKQNDKRKSTCLLLVAWALQAWGTIRDTGVFVLLRARAKWTWIMKWTSRLILCTAGMKKMGGTEAHCCVVVRSPFRVKHPVVVRCRHRQPDIPVPTLSPPPMFVPHVCPLGRGDKYPREDNANYFCWRQSKELGLVWKVFESTFQKKIGYYGCPSLATISAKISKSQEIAILSLLLKPELLFQLQNNGTNDNLVKSSKFHSLATTIAMDCISASDWDRALMLRSYEGCLRTLWSP